MAEFEGGDAESGEDLAAVRAEYEGAMGKKAFHGWSAEELRRKMLIGKATGIGIKPAPDEQPVVATPAVRVMLLCNHVFLPRDPTAAGWEMASDTIRYDGETDGRRTKLMVHPTLAEFLQGRKQAETLD